MQMQPEVLHTATPALDRSIGYAADPLDKLLRLLRAHSHKSVVGDPPASLAHLHQPHFVDAFWDRLQAALSRPVAVDTSLGVRRVSMLGLGVYEFLPDGTIEAGVWQCRSGRAPILEPTDPGIISIVGTPHAAAWLDRFREGFCYEYAERFHASDRDTMLYAKWVWQRFARRVRRSVDMRAVRSTIAKGIAADAWTIAIARRIPCETGRVTLPTAVATYNLVVRNRLAFQTLEREAPNLIPLFGVLVEKPEFPETGQPTRRLKEFLTKTHGFAERTWRMLARGRGRFLAEFLPYYRDDVASATLDLVRVVERLEVRDLPPRWLLEGMLEHYGGRGRPRSEYASGAQFSTIAWRRLALLAARGGQSEASRGIALARVIAWLHDADAPPPDRTLRLASWSWFERKAMKFQVAEQMGHSTNGMAWEMPFRIDDLASLSITPLLDAYSLWHEAVAMRNCVDTYAAKCIAGDVLVCAVRRHGKRRTEAHLLFERTPGGWKLSDMGGFANGLVPEIVRQATQHWQDGEPFIDAVPAQVEVSR